MAEHVWTVLCRKGCQDKETNVITLVEVIEKITVQLPPSEEVGPASGRILVPLQAEVVSWWIRSNDAEEEECCGRLIMAEPDGEENMAHEFPIDLTGQRTGRRSIAKLQGVPVDKGSGVFWFLIQIKDQEGWTEVARIPMRLELLPASQP